MRGTSMSDIGSYNEKLLLQQIRAADGGISQAELVRATHLSRQTVSIIVRRLIAEGLVENAGRRIDGPGKPNTLLRVVADARLTIGVHLDPAHISVVVCDLQANPLASATLAAPSDDPAQDIARIAAEIAELSRRLGATCPDALDHTAEEPPTRVLLGIGIAAPAPLNADDGVVREPPWGPGWRNMPVVAELAAATGLPVILDKDTNAALTGELWVGNLPIDETVLYLYLGHGAGSAVSTRARVHRGATTQAGEIGHLPTGIGDEACSCGRRGCLSLYTDARRLLDHAEQLGVRFPAGLEIPDAVGALAAAATGGDVAAQQTVTRLTTAAASALHTLASIHDPQRIIVGGPVWMAFRDLEWQRLQEVMAGWVAGGDRVIQSSELGLAVGAIGAACLFLERKLSPARGVGADERAEA
jgi:predicted NBD/HSP70 family sugar kinase